MKARILAGLACAVLIFSGCVEAKEEQKSSSSAQTQKTEQIKTNSDKKEKVKLKDGKDAKDLNILRAANDVIDEDDIKLADINWTKPAAGESKRYDRSFENAPPLIICALAAICLKSQKTSARPRSLNRTFIA